MDGKDGLKKSATKMQLLLRSFPPGVAEKLGYYVYRLFDPRNGETFYVGKGKGDRVFAHMRAAHDLEGDEVSNKLQKIREIHLAGLQVGHVIHRHGMTEDAAFHVEGALLDAYPGLTNVVGGHGSGDCGAMHTQQILERYAAKEADFQHRALLITVNHTATKQELYEATRFAWNMDPRRAEQAEVILAVRQGIIRGAFVADCWLPATSQNFPGRTDVPGRIGFIGREADESMGRQYIGRAVPLNLRKKGAANPIRYTWK